MTKLSRIVSIGLISAAVLTASAPAFATSDLSPAGHTFISAEQQAFEARIAAERRDTLASANSQPDFNFDRPDWVVPTGADGGSINRYVIDDIVKWVLVNILGEEVYEYCDDDGCILLIIN